jgi:hypothetical protein
MNWMRPEPPFLRLPPLVAGGTRSHNVAFAWGRDGVRINRFGLAALVVAGVTLTGCGGHPRAVSLSAGVQQGCEVDFHDARTAPAGKTAQAALSDLLGSSAGRALSLPRGGWATHGVGDRQVVFVSAPSSVWTFHPPSGGPWIVENVSTCMTARAHRASRTTHP